MPVSKHSISMMPDVTEQVERRGRERSTEINRSLQRYYELMRICRADLRQMLSDKEMALILDTFNGTAFMDVVSIRLAWANVEDAIEMDGLDRKWEVDGAALTAKVKDLDFAHAAALVDAAEMWWNRVAHGEQPEYGEALQ